MTRIASMAADGTLGIAGGAGCVQQHPWVGRRNNDVRLTVACGCQKFFIVAPSGWAGVAPEMHDAPRRHTDHGSDLLDNPSQFILDDKCGNLRVGRDEGDFPRHETEVDGNRDQTRLGGGRVDLRPFDAVVGEHGDTVALAQPEAQQRVGQTACPRIPRTVGHGPFEIADAGDVGSESRLCRKRLAKRQCILLHGDPQPYESTS
jgi:hypothetical protein